MVLFQCGRCGENVTLNKADSHLTQCWNTCFSCLDCQVPLWGEDVRNHTSCVGSAHNHPSNFYDTKKQRPTVEFREPPVMERRRTPYQAYVKDADEEPSPLNAALAEVYIPPRAPSPPAAALPPVNVFDFLVSGSASPSPASSVSSFASNDDSDVSMSPELGRSPMLSRSPSRTDFAPSKGHVYSEALYSYGSGPVEVSNERFDSELDLDMQLQRVEQPSASENALILQTPAPIHAASPHTRNQLDSRSDKKRKRTQVEDLDLTNATARSNPTTLHSGLTGGLMKLTHDSAEIGGEASPLSPKKRSKPSRELKSSKSRKHKNEESSQHQKERRHRHKRQNSARDMVIEPGKPSANTGGAEHRSRKHGGRLLLEGRKDLKAIEYYPNSALQNQNRATLQQTDHECNSAFFLRLVDKDHHSVKGQSLWGLLKMFHEGRRQVNDIDSHASEEIRNKEERFLWKGLRAKISKNGDIVLFSRPEAETDE